MRLSSLTPGATLTGPPAGRRAHGPMKDKQRLRENSTFSLEAKPQVKKHFLQKAQEEGSHKKGGKSLTHAKSKHLSTLFYLRPGNKLNKYPIVC